MPITASRTAAPWSSSSARASASDASSAAAARSASAAATPGSRVSGSRAVRSVAAIRSSRRRYERRIASTPSAPPIRATGTPASGSAPTAASSSARTSPTGTPVPGASSSTTSRCSGCALRSSPSATDAPTTASSRSRAGPCSASAAASRSRRGPSASTAPAIFASDSRAWSGSADSASAGTSASDASGAAPGSPSGPDAARGASSSGTAASPPTSRSSAASASSRSARATSANPARVSRPASVLPRPVDVLTRSEHREEAAQLVGGDLRAVLLPLALLVLQHEVEHVLAQRLGDELGPLHDRDRVLQRGGQRLDAQRAALGVGQLPHVVVGALGQLVALLDALEARGEQHRERQVRVGGRVDRAVLDARRVGLARLVHRHPDQRGPVVVAPADVRRRLGAAPQPLVRVGELVGHRGDLGGVLEQAGDERARRLRQLQVAARLVERVPVALEQRQVRVHARARLVGQRLRH